MQDDSGYRMV